MGYMTSKYTIILKYLPQFSEMGFYNHVTIYVHLVRREKLTDPAPILYTFSTSPRSHPAWMSQEVSKWLINGL